MKQKHWLEHLDELERRRRHKERHAANRARERAIRRAAGIPPRKGLYAHSGGFAAAMMWFDGLPPETQARIVAPSPDGRCKRGRGRVVRAFQQHLVAERDLKKQQKERDGVS